MVDLIEQLPDGDPRQVGDYMLRGRLGSGRTGQVFLGTSPTGLPAAVKVIHPQLAASPGFRARLAREVETARRVTGPRTVPVIDADLDAPLPWLATAYVDGPSLAAAVAANGPLPASAVLTLAAGLAETVRGAHASGVVHGGLQPANVLLAADGPRLTDFGIARAMENPLAARDGLPDGASGFQAPETAARLDVTTASDIYGLGAVLLYAVTGRQMPEGAASVSQVPGELRPVIEHCMAADPAQRPSAAELAEGLSVLARRAPVAAATMTAGPAPGHAPQGYAAPGSLAQGDAPSAVTPYWTAPMPAGRGRRDLWLMTAVALVCAMLGAGVVYLFHL